MRTAATPLGAASIVALIMAVPAALDGQVTATVRVTVRAALAAAPAGRDDDRAAQAAGRPDEPTATVPVGGAIVTVRATGFAALTNAGGIAVLRGLSPGRHALTISALGFVEATAEVEAANGRVARASVVLAPAPVRLAGLDVRVASRAGAGRATVVETAGLSPAVADLAAALDRVPGATVVRRGGPGAPAVVQLRGSGGDQVLVLLDGTPINSPLTGEADLGTVDLAQVARIVVIPGSQSARYGPRALGGVVLLESRDDGVKAFTAGAGSWSSAQTAASASRALGDAWSVAGAARWRHSRGAFAYDVPAFRGGGETTRKNAAFTQAGGDVRVARRGRRLRPSLRAHLSNIERGSPGTIAQPSPSGRQHHRRWGLSTRIEAGGAEAAGADLDGTSLGGSARTAIQWQRAGFTDPAPPVGRPYDTRTRVRRADVALEAWWGPSLRFGLDAARLAIESNVLASPAIELGEQGVWARAGHARELGRGVRLDLGAAIRADRHALLEGTTASPAVDATITRAGLMLDLRWGRGFSPPGLGDLFFQEGVLVEPNPDLRPERIRGELSASLARAWSLGRAAGRLHGTVYRADLDDMILWFPDHRFVWSPDNYDVSRRGLELGVAADLSTHAGTHSLSAGAAWSEVEYTGPVLDGQVAYRPRFTADLSLRVALPGVTFMPAATHVGERRTVPGSSLNALAGYTVLDAGIAIPVAFGKVPGRFEFAVNNLLDERASLLADYPLPGRGWSTRLRIGAGP